MNLRTYVILVLVGAIAAPSLKAQICKYNNIRRSAPDDRYVVNVEQGTLLDKKTGLTWKRCVEGQTGEGCDSGNVLYLNWGQALSRAAASTYAGFKDWRLPSYKELESLVEIACIEPAINTTVFPNDTGDWVWSSSPVQGGGNSALYVDFSGGEPYSDLRYNSGLAVRLVRGGQ